MTDATLPAALWTRPGEQLLAVRAPDVGNCTACGQPLAEGMFRWERNQPNPIFPEDDGRYPALRHADGSPDHDASMFAKPRCPDCRGEELSYADSGYGTTASCPCGWSKYTDRGD